MTGQTVLLNSETTRRAGIFSEPGTQSYVEYCSFRVTKAVQHCAENSVFPLHWTHEALTSSCGPRKKVFDVNLKKEFICWDELPRGKRGPKFSKWQQSADRGSSHTQHTRKGLRVKSWLLHCALLVYAIWTNRLRNTWFPGTPGFVFLPKSPVLSNQNCTIWKPRLHKTGILGGNFIKDSLLFVLVEHNSGCSLNMCPPDYSSFNSNECFFFFFLYYRPKINFVLL